MKDTVVSVIYRLLLIPEDHTQLHKTYYGTIISRTKYAGPLNFGLKTSVGDPKPAKPPPTGGVSSIAFLVMIKLVEFLHMPSIRCDINAGVLFAAHCICWLF